MVRRLIAAVFILPGPAALAQDAAAGEEAFNQCKACHMVGEDATNRDGPLLIGVIGRSADRYQGHRYGTSMHDAARETDRRKARGLKTAANTLCVRNLDGHALFFAVETTAADRQTATLAPGERLCITAAGRSTGMVQVFESDDAFEGCSRLVPVGNTEDMLKYVDFDRCFWGSNT